MPLPEGSLLGPYQIVAPLGAGGMGEVYRARDTRLGRDVALKILPPEFAKDPARRARFEQEVRAVAALNHPNIIALYDVGENYFVTELVDGGSLRGAQLPLRKAVDLAAQIADGLAAAHATAITHRDLKPDNILMTRDGRAKILDFGLAKVDTVPGPGEATRTAVNTAAGIVMGTIGYMSPEQVRTQPIDHRSDIFSFGLVVYELLAGRPAFIRDSAAETMSAIARDEAPDLPTSVPGPLRQIVQRCLEKDRLNRFDSARDLAFALRSLSSSGIHVPSLAELPLPPVLVPRSRERAFAALAILGFAAAGVMAWLRFQNPVPPARVVKVEINPPSATAVFDGYLALSPDGRTLAYSAHEEGKPSQLWLRPLDSEARPVPGTENAQMPTWSPDGKHLAFVANGLVMRTAVAGGAPQKLAETAINVDWSPAGVLLYSVQGGSRNSLQRIPASGGAPSEASDAKGTLQFPRFLPDGRHFLHVIRADQSNALYVGRLGDPSFRKKILEEPVRALYSPGTGGKHGYLVYQRFDGALIAHAFDPARLEVRGDPMVIASSAGRFAYTVTSSGHLAYSGSDVSQSQLVWLDRAGTRLAASEPGHFDSPSISPDGNTVALTFRKSPETPRKIWFWDPKSNRMTRFTYGDSADRYPRWSPDGSRIVFNTGRGIRIQPVQGQAEAKLIDHHFIPESWTPDGRTLIASNPSPIPDLYSMPLDGKPSRLIATEFSEHSGQVSADGRWLAYSSSESGIDQVYVQPFPPNGSKWQVSAKGGTEPYWRSDGREIYFLSPDNTLMVAEVSSSASFSIGSVKPLFKMAMRPLSNSRYNYSASRDGQRFVVNAVMNPGEHQPITLILNWQSMLDPGAR